MDIDIDFQTNFTPKQSLPGVIVASMVKKSSLVKHPCGHYLQTMPVDKVTGLAAIPFDAAQEIGYTKLDFLHLSILDKCKSKQELRALANIDPSWELLQDSEVVSKLFQLKNHADLLSLVKPTTLEELADCVAMIRPSKIKYVGQYIRNKAATRPLLYRHATDDKSAFRRSHAIAYATTIVVQLNMIELGRM